MALNKIKRILSKSIADDFKLGSASRVPRPKPVHGPKLPDDWVTGEDLKAHGVFGEKSNFGDQLSVLGGWAKNNVHRSLQSEGISMFGALRNSAVRGAVGGAAIGGINSEAHGGSFWDGAKSGAFNGAALWSGHRMGMRATGATSRNPFGKKGMLGAGANMWSSLSKDSNISRPALKLLKNDSMAGLTKSVMNHGRKQKG